MLLLVVALPYFIAKYNKAGAECFQFASRCSTIESTFVFYK